MMIETLYFHKVSRTLGGNVASQLKKDYRRKYRNPDPELARRILHRRLTLDELFVDGRSDDDTTFDDKCLIVELAIVKAFRDSTVILREAEGQKVTCPMPNRIPGVSGSIEELANWIVNQMPHGKMWKIVRRRDFPDHIAHLSQSWIERVAVQAVQMLVVAMLLDMRNGDEWNDCNELYYQFHDDIGDFAWVVPPSVTDRHDELRVAVRDLFYRSSTAQETHGLPRRPKSQKPRLKHDRRPFHGKPGRDRKRKATPQGNSCGYNAA